MIGLSEIVRHLFLLAVMVYCLIVLVIAVVVLLVRFHEHWFVGDAVRFRRCPNCGVAESQDGRSSLRLLLSPPPPAGVFINRRFGRFVRCRVCNTLCFAYSRNDRAPGFGTWHGDVDFEVVGGEEARSVIDRQSQLLPRCVFLHAAFVAAALVCMRFLVMFYAHALIALVGVSVVVFLLTRPKPKRPKRKYTI